MCGHTRLYHEVEELVCGYTRLYHEVEECVGTIGCTMKENTSVDYYYYI